MKQGLIFDIDGTLWDATSTITASWNEVLDAQPLPHRHLTASLAASCMGLTMDQWALTLMPQLDEPTRLRLLAACMDNENRRLPVQGGRLYPHLHATFEILHRRYHISILSNCGPGYIDCLVRFAHLQQLVDDQLCFGDTDLDKADNIPLLIERTGLDQAVYVGDTCMDQQACRQAHVPFIHAAYGFGQVDDAVWSITDLDQLPDLVPQVFAAH